MNSCPTCTVAAALSAYSSPPPQRLAAALSASPEVVRACYAYTATRSILAALGSSAPPDAYLRASRAAEAAEDRLSHALEAAIH